MKDAAHVSVSPYPCTTGQHIVTCAAAAITTANTDSELEWQYDRLSKDNPIKLPPTLRKSSTWRASGAPPVMISFTRPPSRCFTLLNTSLSKNGAACCGPQTREDDEHRHSAQPLQAQASCPSRLRQVQGKARCCAGAEHGTHGVLRVAGLNIVQLSLKSPVEHERLQSARLLRSNAILACELLHVATLLL